MNVMQIYVNKDGQWWEPFEYHKHHQEKYPNAIPFLVLKQDTAMSEHYYLPAMAKLFAAELD